MLDLEGFRQYLYEEEMSKNTVTNYCAALKSYGRQFDEITKGNLIEWKQEQLARFRPATVNARIAALLSYCKYKRIPMHLKSVKMPRRTFADNVISREQLNTLLRGLDADGLRWWIVNIKLLAGTGMRISEAVRITKRDIMNGSVTMHTKDHMRTIYFPDALTDGIRQDIAALSPGDQIIRGRPRNSKTPIPITVGGFQEGLKLLSKRYGIPKEVMHPHSFRHFFAIEFLRNKNDIAMLADLLGHSSIDMTRIYLRKSQEQQKDAVNQAVDWLMV